jgi:hypothetical protein
MADHQELKAMVKRWQTEVDQAEGAVTQLTRQLQEQFACETWEQAEALLTKLQREMSVAEKKYLDLQQKFEKRYGKYLH